MKQGLGAGMANASSGRWATRLYSIPASAGQSRLFDLIQQERIREWATRSCCFWRRRHAGNTVFCSSERQIAHRLVDGDKNQGKGARQSTNLLADAHFQTLVIGVAVEELPKWGNLYMSSMVRRTL